jgi:phosphoribosylanthranilate isomerase
MQHRTRIKICCVTRVQDALAAARHGADAIGLIFQDASARNMAIDEARAIVSSLPPFVTPVAVFADATPEHIADVADQIGVHDVQLNGHWTGAHLRRLAKERLRVSLAVRVEPTTFDQQIRAVDRMLASAIVLETAGTGLAGGSGVANDWALVRQHQSAGTFDGAPPIIAAGGLTPETVGEVIRTLRPWGVDVCSGVESAKRIKSEDRIQAFCQAVRAADAGLARS